MFRVKNYDVFQLRQKCLSQLYTHKKKFKIQNQKNVFHVTKQQHFLVWIKKVFHLKIIISEEPEFRFETSEHEVGCYLPGKSLLVFLIKFFFSFLSLFIFHFKFFLKRKLIKKEKKKLLLEIFANPKKIPLFPPLVQNNFLSFLLTTQNLKLSRL